ncbi:hypothetical protein IIA79_06420 [bacterium]|nr:hypothetical protein [bacterium]
MAEKSKACPKCSGTMLFRLGGYECSQCDHHEPASPAKPEGKHGLRKEAWHQPPAAAPPPPGSESLPGSAPPTHIPAARSAQRPRLGMKMTEDSVPRGSLAQEKLAFVTVFFVVQMITSFITVSGLLGAQIAAYSLLDLAISALFATLCIGFVLYYDNDCLRQAFLMFVGLGVIAALVTIGLAIASSQFVLVLPLLPGTLMSAWLISILTRDSRSG